MDNEKKFKTKTGFCHILPDKIVLTRDGIIGNTSTIIVGNNISKILIIYGGFSVGLLYFTFDNYRNGQIAQSIVFGLMAFFLIYSIVTSINNSATPIINRQKIKEIKFKKSVVGLTRSRFEVLFENDLGQIKRRIIMLPGSLTDGQAETEKAIKIMTDEKLISIS
jgi:hypothetical protein